ncbi:MAG: hydrogenase accessory protein HypB, partial [Lachnospiraceae bacterium]|nr:hydrogenase accessory protein HypB [Lachnospiraceae bacterium]
GPAFDFNFAVLRSRVLDLNPDMNIIRMSSLTGDGFDEWTEYLVRMIERQIRNGGNNEDH